MAAVHHHRQLHRAGSAPTVQSVQSGPHGAAREQHVVHQHHHLLVEVHGDVRLRLGNHWPQTDVVAVQGHIEGAGGHRLTLDLGEGLGDAAGDGDAAGLQADHHQGVRSVIALDHLVGHAADSALHVVSAHHLGA